MKTIFIIFIMMFSVSVFAEDKVFIKDSQFKIITLDNLNEDQFPMQLNRFVSPYDHAIGCMYLDEYSGEQFFVIIRNNVKHLFDDGCSYGNKNVKMRVNLITVYRGLKVYDFITWSN